MQQAKKKGFAEDLASAEFGSIREDIHVGGSEIGTPDFIAGISKGVVTAALRNRSNQGGMTRSC